MADDNTTWPTSATAAANRAAAGDWTAFGTCPGCAAPPGSPCLSLALLRAHETVRPTKRRPCATRPWRSE
jgi:hypothetical protein